MGLIAVDRLHGALGKDGDVGEAQYLDQVHDREEYLYDQALVGVGRTISVPVTRRPTDSYRLRR